jgi:hypothetical protein
MQGRDLVPGAGATVTQVPHDFGIGVQFDLVLEVLVGQRSEPDAGSQQRGLR